MRYVTVAEYRTEVTEPITLGPGDVFRIVQEFDADYPGWFLCAVDDGSQAWVPVEIIERDGEDAGRGTVTEAYTNRELDVAAGDTLDGERELLGWLWATNTRTDETGWVPLDNVRRLAAN